jgi:hypothetical protein
VPKYGKNTKFFGKQCFRRKQKTRRKIKRFDGKRQNVFYLFFLHNFWLSDCGLFGFGIYDTPANALAPLMADI